MHRRQCKTAPAVAFHDKLLFDTSIDEDARLPGCERETYVKLRVNCKPLDGKCVRCVLIDLGFAVYGDGTEEVLVLDIPFIFIDERLLHCCNYYVIASFLMKLNVVQGSNFSL